MRVAVRTSCGLATVLAGLACLSSTSAQETKAPAEESQASVQAQADKGDADAQLTLGHTYFLKDKAEAVRWYRKAAEQGHATAQSSFGYMYAMANDREEAQMWLSLAASRATGNNQKEYADLRDLVAKKMPPNRSPKRSVGRGSGNRRPRRNRRNPLPSERGR